MSASPIEASEAKAPDLLLRTRPPSPKRLSRKVLLAGALTGGAIVAFALMSGLSEGPSRRSNGEESAVSASGNPPESITQAQSSYGAEDLPRGLSEPLDTHARLEPPDDAIWANASQSANSERHEAASATRASPSSSPSPEEVAGASAIFFSAERRPNAVEARDGEHALSSRLTPVRSRYELQSGHVIPAALVTALNSDLPGHAIAQVTAPVYDSVSGEHLLIPQGARLIGAYGGGGRYGEERLLLVWTRLILPNGASIDLREMPASDGAGASGLSDRTDNHLGRLGVAIGLSAVMSVVANESEDDGEDNGSLSQSVGDAAAAQAAQTGGRIVDRELSVRPTLRIRAGAPVRVLVTRDIQMRPYASASR